jgi:hypothetical protein
MDAHLRLVGKQSVSQPNLQKWDTKASNVYDYNGKAEQAAYAY